MWILLLSTKVVFWIDHDRGSIFFVIMVDTLDLHQDHVEEVSIAVQEMCDNLCVCAEKE